MCQSYLPELCHIFFLFLGKLIDLLSESEGLLSFHHSLETCLRFLLKSNMMEISLIIRWAFATKDCWIL